MFSWKRVVCGIVFLPALVLAAPSEPPAKTVTGRVEVRHPGKPEFVSGTVSDWDDTTLTMKVKGTDQTVKWADLTGVSAYALRSRLIDKKDAKAWLKLGTLAWGLNDVRDGKIALTEAQKLDPSLKDDVEAVESSSAGILLDPPAPELMHSVPDDPDESAAKIDPKALKAKYLKTAPDAAKASLAANRAEAKGIAKEFNIDFKEVESDHFLVFTDWPPSSYNFIKQNLEAANACVSKQFDISPTENIFVGKLAVYMFETHEEFLHFAVAYDHLPNSQGLAGYYTSRGAMAHMAMSKPGFGQGHEQEIEWAYVLTHEFTHAFVARYRSARHLPTWINEGIAEVVASSQFPREVKSTAREVAEVLPSLSQLFDDRAGIQSGEMYPVMRTLTEVLILKDKKKFLAMFDEMKAGANGAKALKDNYGMTFSDLEKLWREYIKH